MYFIASSFVGIARLLDERPTRKWTTSRGTLPGVSHVVVAPASSVCVRRREPRGRGRTMTKTEIRHLQRQTLGGVGVAADHDDPIEWPRERQQSTKEGSAS
jgi:hypothetical protein